MKRLLLVAVVVLAAAVAADDLVDAAKAAKAKRKGSKTKVITNADVKKSKGKVVETPPATTATTDTAAAPSLADQYERSYRDRLVADAERAAAEKKVADLEKELAAVEQSYYEENDLDKRDKEIVKKFEDVQVRLAKAREELKAANTQHPTPNTP